ncbi:MAG: helix-hairpin-helix domain-containing protein [Deltaproteobacteria bacterium]|nr:helix-hairpin-helix domain-containing protein [Deltaproteobacteria bacterium]
MDERKDAVAVAAEDNDRGEPRDLSTLLWSLVVAVALAVAIAWLALHVVPSPAIASSWRPVEPDPVFVELQLPTGGAAVWRIAPGATLEGVLLEAGIAAGPATPYRTCRTGDSYRVRTDGSIDAGRMTGEQMLALGIRIPLNEATVSDLLAIPGVGSALAARLAARRAGHGGFGSYEAVGEVPGVGAHTLQLIQRYTAL